jgi:hypothetical protein
MMKSLNFARGTIALALVLGAGVCFSASTPSASGDIVGRELNYCCGLGSLGHVGMWTGTKVLEVMNEKTVIQTNSLSNFKGRTSYWGARYGKGSKPYRAINWGLGQRSFSPQYTKTAQYQIGEWTNKRVWDSRTRKWVTKRVMTPAKFRCDTFVHASYLHGDGTKLVTFITPKWVYNAMPKQR